MNVHSSQSARADDKREAILEAALELFADRGFDGTSVPAVAKRAGIATGTIYRYFDDKGALVNDVYRTWKRVLMTGLMTGFPFDAAPRDQFRALWVRLSSFVRAHPTPFAFLELHHHAPYLDHTSRSLEENSLRPLVAFADRAREAGLTKPLPSEALIALVWGVFVGIVKANRMGHLELTDELLDGLETCTWDAIAPHPDGGRS